MIRLTVTYTRQTAETPWYWQVAPSSALSPVYDFVEANNSGVETDSHVIENQCIVSFTFIDEQLIEGFQSIIESEIKSPYVQYCEDNNITIDVSVEEI
jgi:hypothetical protein